MSQIETHKMAKADPLNVILDTTLKDLYALDGTLDRGLVLVYAVPTADVQMSSGIPLSSKFVYQSPLSHCHDGDELARLFLQVVPQLFGFIAGNMPLILFDLDPNDQEHLANTPRGPQRPHVVDALQVFEGLIPQQRPQTTFVANPGHIDLSPGVGIAITSPMDCLLDLPHDVNPEAHYQCLSKRALASSGLPTPNSVVIDTGIQPHQVHDAECIKAEVSRMLEPILERTLPFAVKMPQALAGQGTFLIQTEAARQKAVETLAKEIERMLREVNDDNKHLYTCSLVIQDLIDGETAALSFFVTKAGRVVFICCTEQIMDSIGHWGGAFISYSQQDDYQKRYVTILEQMARYVHEKGYRGPMNADVMTDPHGRQLIVDLNVRAAGSHPLGLLRNHFSIQRGLHKAVLLFPLYLKGTKDEFQWAFEEEFRAGSLIICGWCHDRVGIDSISCLILAAETKEKLDTFIDAVNQHKLPE